MKTMIVLIVAYIFGMPVIFMAAWNYVVPSLFGIPYVSYLDALCLMVLSHFLFGKGIKTGNSD